MMALRNVLQKPVKNFFWIEAWNGNSRSLSKGNKSVLLSYFNFISIGKLIEMPASILFHKKALQIYFLPANY